MPATAGVPALPNIPPATRCPLGNTASAITDGCHAEPTPAPNAVHEPVAGSYAAMPRVSTVPTRVNSPPTTTSGVSGPAPSGSHVIAAYTLPFAPVQPAPGCHCREH